MATRGPASVLDRRDTDSSATHVVRDRLTRQRSPARPTSNRYSYSSDCSEEEVVTSRITQPYRTSFSAVAAPIRTKKDRSRSTSPCTSSLKGSDRSRSKSPGGRRSRKHVTYDDRVVIRESDANNSAAGTLTSETAQSGESVVIREDMPVSKSNMSANSASRPMDYSSELRELSQQIVREYSSPAADGRDKNSPLSSQGRNVKSRTANGKMSPASGPGSRSNGATHDNRTKIIVKDDYDHDRSISYRAAVTSHYSDEVKQKADALIEEMPLSAEESKKSQQAPEERRGSLPVDEKVEASRLTREKRSISASIGNFFRRLSPHLGRKHKKGSLSNASSQSLSRGGDDLDGSFDRHASTNSLSRGKFRRSLRKFFGKSKKGGKGDTSFEDLNQSQNSSTDSPMGSMSKSSRYMKSIEHSSKSDKDMYHKFKDKQQTPVRSGESNAPMKPRVLTSSPRVGSPESRTVTEPGVTDRAAVSSFKESRRGSSERMNKGDMRNTPPNSLDVRATVPKSNKSLQISQLSAISGDDYSIGECSIDPNLTGRSKVKKQDSGGDGDVEGKDGNNLNNRKEGDGTVTDTEGAKQQQPGSEPSLVSETSASKQVVSSQVSQEAIVPSHASSIHSQNPSAGRDITQTPKRLDLRSSGNDKRRSHDLNLTYPQMPIISDSAQFLPKESVRTPSYLRISSAVSGYGHYSKYSAYKGIEKRTPYSSTLSLRSSISDLTTPLSPIEMPIGKLPNLQAPTNYPPIQSNVLTPKTSANGTDTVDSCGVDMVNNGARDKIIEDVTNGLDDLRKVNAGLDDLKQVSLGLDDLKQVSSGLDDVREVSVNGEMNGENGHSDSGHVVNFVSTGDHEKDSDFFLGLAEVEENRLLVKCSQCELELQCESIPDEACGKIRSAVGKANLLIGQKFRQFQELCDQHKHPDKTEGGKPVLCEDLQGFWEMVKLQVDDVDEMFTEIELMKQNGWREIKVQSRRSSASSSPKSGSLSVSNTSTPSHTPGSKRRAARLKDSAESSPERTQKAKMAAKAREEARKKLLAEKRAAMEQQKLNNENNENVEIYIAENSSKSNSPSRSKSNSPSRSKSNSPSRVTEDV